MDDGALVPLFGADGMRIECDLVREEVDAGCGWGGHAPSEVAGTASDE